MLIGWNSTRKFLKPGNSWFFAIAIGVLFPNIPKHLNPLSPNDLTRQGEETRTGFQILADWTLEFSNKKRDTKYRVVWNLVKSTSQKPLLLLWMLQQLLGIMWAKNHDYLGWNGLFRNAFRSQWWTWNLLQTFSVASSHCNNKLLYFCNVFTQDNSLFCYLNNVTLQACVLGKLLLATKPTTKTVIMGKQATWRVSPPSPTIRLNKRIFNPLFFFASPHRRASFACKAQRNVVEDPGCCKISHKDCATAFRFQEHILTAQSGATWSSWWCWWCRKAYTSWCDFKTIQMNTLI